MTNSEQRGPAGDRAAEVSAIRIGDVERNSAVTALGEHMTTGRIDLDEYGTRSALATSARTVGDLQALFADLPAPHPLLPGVGSAPAVRRSPAGLIAPGGTSPAMVDDRNRAQKFVAAAAGSSTIIALVLFFATGYQWWWFLLIPLISSVAGGIWGDSWKRPDQRR